MLINMLIHFLQVLDEKIGSTLKSIWKIMKLQPAAGCLTLAQTIKTRGNN